MSSSLFTRRLLVALALFLVAGIAPAQAQPAADYHPEVGQDGKDVVWVPTAQTLVDKMLDMAKVTPRDYVIDLGSGDGRTVITAAKRGARALGIEYNPEMVDLSRRNAAREGMGEKARFVKADLFESDFSRATVVTMFLLPEINIKLRPKILDLRPGTRVVSNSFDMGEWEADQTVSAPDGCESYCRAYLWIVPAKVRGTWKFNGGELRVDQTFQMLSGTLKAGNRLMPISGGRTNGDKISFTAGGARYAGRVNGNTIEGEIVSGSRRTSWTATR